MKRGRPRKEVAVDTSRYFCWNKECSEYRKRGKGNIIFAQYDGIHKNIMYLKCTSCGKKFSENKGTIFYNKRTNKKTIEQVLKSTSEGVGIRATARIFNINKNTVLSLVHQSGKHCEEVEKFFSKSQDKRGSN
jgi:transposase-like protein